MYARAAATKTFVALSLSYTTFPHHFGLWDLDFMPYKLMPHHYHQEGHDRGTDRRARGPRRGTLPERCLTAEVDAAPRPGRPLRKHAGVPYSISGYGITL
ncbi:hypothetical protein EVAR_22117_1 [Eumeta japonica]|uniref:Uncharacterized protein n=1 Tax=Eumeta variegata TaxID=151549 RepID=A0A4C1VZJ9_EUMVA|nr:hypothetical protein EVAR_22117_1 [Eumeta japonica]